MKVFGSVPDGAAGRYSPAQRIGAKIKKISAIPTRSISRRVMPSATTSISGCTRAGTGLTNAFSKKVENHAHAMALHFLYYNFVRVHKTLRTSPMAAVVTKRLWEMSDVVDVLEAWESAACWRAPCHEGCACQSCPCRR